ncbi:MAG: hypothetical protein AB9842_03630 [Bacteroidales bacterium]
MEKKNKMAKVYGYLVCLVAVITLIINFANIVTSVLDLQDPLHAGFISPNSPSLASYNNYKMDVTRTSDKSLANFTPNDTILREMFESAKTYKIDSVKHDAIKSITVNSVLVVFCVLLFLVHWRWMRKLDKEEIETPTVN